MVPHLVLCLLLLSSGTAHSQDLVQCFTDSTNCVASASIVSREECCDNSIQPLGGSYNAEDGLGCQLCDVVFGFAETTLIGPESPEAYTVGFGFLSGFAMDIIEVNFQLNNGTASEGDLILSPRTLTFLPEQRLLTNISLEFVTDGVARELNETFTITFTGVEPRDLEFGATIIPEFTGAIVDVDVPTSSESPETTSPSDAKTLSYSLLSTITIATLTLSTCLD